VCVCVCWKVQGGGGVERALQVLGDGNVSKDALLPVLSLGVHVLSLGVYSAVCCSVCEP